MNKSSNKFALDKSSLELFLAAQSSKYNKIAYFSSIEYDFDDIKNKLLKINPKLNDQEFKELEEILNLPDNLLLDIILKKEKIPANYDNPVMKKIFKTCNDKSSE